jgi:putative SOS response-associated peptidase YedK
MCTLYRIRNSHAEIARVFKASPDALPNEPTPDVYPDRLAPVVRAKDDGREVLTMRWGFPPPPQGNAPVVNVRNVASPYWRGWLKPEWRCLVPFTSFSEWTDTTPKSIRWFALGDAEPTGAFAGI